VGGGGFNREEVQVGICYLRVEDIERTLRKEGEFVQVKRGVSGFRGSRNRGDGGRLSRTNARRVEQLTLLFFFTRSGSH